MIKYNRVNILAVEKGNGQLDPIKLLLQEAIRKFQLNELGSSSLKMFNHIKILHGKGVRLMLVVGRKPGQYIVINEKIIIKVIKGEEGQLRLAIEAPKDISIVRGELLKE